MTHFFGTLFLINFAIGVATGLVQEFEFDDWVRELPDGLDTLVGEDGRRHSGGQRQRLTLARTLLSDAPVLVLDEPTAHLDPETAEAVVREALEAAGDRTVLLITHRPEGLDLVDEIVALAPWPAGAAGRR